MSEEREPEPLHWLLVSLLGWVVHVCIAAGLWSRVAMIGPRYEQRYAEFSLALPWVTQQVLDVTKPKGEGMTALVLGGLALLDLAILVGLARWERPLFKWWFWGVLVVLLLAWPVVEFALYLPEVKLRQGLAK